jgi:hypothetical protein
MHLTIYLEQVTAALDEFLSADIVGNGDYVLENSYHYQDQLNQLRFRYDNARHRPALPFREHKHLADLTIVAAPAPNLIDVLGEVRNYLPLP